MGIFYDGTVMNIINNINNFYLIYNYVFLFYATNIYPNVTIMYHLLQRIKHITETIKQ